MISTAREILGIESLTAAFITDALLTAIPEIAYDMNKISTEEKEIIIALNFIALNADNQKHILEIDACRNAMATLSISAISNTALGTHTKKSISDLIKTLNPSNHPVALLYILRMVVADGRIQSDEISLLREVSNGLPKNQIKFLHMVTIFETGKFFKLA
jgi:sulfur carrier protein ThiS